MQALTESNVLPTYARLDVTFTSGEGAFDGGIVPKLRAAALAAASGITATIGRTAVTA